MFSNTLALIERGWSGVLVEPSLAGFSRLLELHGKRDNLKLVQTAIGLNRSIVPFWNSEDGLSTTEKENFDRWSYCANFKPPCYLPQITIRDLVDAFPSLLKADFVNIDTEGTSAELFLHFPFGLLRPKMICVEYDDKLDKIEELASNLGYRSVYKSSENVIVVRGD